MKNPAIIERIERELSGREAEKLFRRTAAAEQNGHLDLSTNSYLRLESNPQVLEQARKLAAGELAGNGASRLIATRSPLYEALETELARWKSCESALLFNSGYAANVGTLQALCSRDTEVFSDRLNHASIVDGIRLSGARMSRYAHCDTDDLAGRLKRSTAREKLIVTDTVFSMDGDRAPLERICSLAAEHGALVMVDEAHAAGVLGKRLSGLVEACGMEEQVQIRIGTLSKAVAGLGGFFAGSSRIRDYLVNSARSLIYSTALPHSVLAWDLAAVRFIVAHPEMGPQLLERAASLRNELTHMGFDTLDSSTQIVPCIVGDDSRALALSRELRYRGIKAPAIRPPTVPRGTARLRFSVHLELSSEQTDSIVGHMRQWKAKND
jgi:8-amino-7-oxononanoate synthase